MINVSVIVPIHNAGKYLSECLDALHAQTLQEMEIILVRDCPTDGSDQVAKRYARTDKRFIIIENATNLHIGNSRNKGISVAKGEYIAFCDHDDIMEPEMYQALYSQALISKADIVISQPAILQNGTKQIWDIPCYEETSKKEHILADLLSSGGTKQNISHFCNIHNVLYRTSLMKEHAIQFVDTKTTNPEDVFFNIENIYSAKQVIISNQPLYYHRIIDESTGHQTQYLGWKNRFRGLEYMYQWIVTHHLYSSMQCDFYLMVQKKISDGLISIIIHRKGWKEFQTAYRQARQYPFTKAAFKNYRDEQQRPLTKKIIRRLLAYSLAL